MSVSVEVPSLGESVTEGYIAEWLVKVGDHVAVDEIIVELETDKITITVPAPVAGKIVSLNGEIDDAVAVGAVIAVIEPGAEASGGAAKVDDAGKKDAAKTAQAPAAPPKQEAPAEKAEPAAQHDTLTPAVSRLIEENNLDPAQIQASGPGGRLLKGDVLDYLQKQKSSPAATPEKTGVTVDRAPAPVRQAPGSPAGPPQEERVKMSRLRQTIARRLVEAQHNAAMLTTFNEADMSGIMEIRKKYQKQFVDRYGIKLGFMSFFVKAAVEALKAFPAVNAEIDGDELVYKNYYHIGVAIGGGDKGLVVPVIRDADQLGFAEVELAIAALAGKVKDNTLTLADLQGGTFSISNGGIYGSMLSTPILNPPQSGILGMHNIIERPVAIDGKVEIRPMMYLALTYDHRVIDGREAVSFLKLLADLLEDPERILLEV